MKKLIARTWLFFRVFSPFLYYLHAITYNFINNTCPYYLNKIFESAPRCRIDTRHNFAKLISLFSENYHEAKNNFLYLSLYMKQLAWLIYKKANSLNTFKRNVKKHYLSWIMNMRVVHCVSVCMYVCVSIGVCIYAHMDINFCVFLWIIHSHDFRFSFCLSLTLFSYFHSDLRDHIENKVFLPILCYSFLMLFKFASSNILTSPFIFYISRLLFLLRLRFRFNKFMIFQFSYSFLLFLFMAEYNLLTYLKWLTLT